MGFMQDIPSKNTNFDGPPTMGNLLKLVNEIHRLNMAIKAIENMNMKEIQQDAGDYEIKKGSMFNIKLEIG